MPFRNAPATGGTAALPLPRLHGVGCHGEQHALVERRGRVALGSLVPVIADGVRGQGTVVALQNPPRTRALFPGMAGPKKGSPERKEHAMSVWFGKMAAWAGYR